MVWLIRTGMYLLSGFTIWSFVQNPGLVSDNYLALDQINSMVLGVCAGVSNYIGIDVSLIRLVFALSALYRGVGAVLYVLAFLILPVS